uniref:Uncharacterized protein n=1 Tax=viral metagenome TaxID=1070528 RepID=A0A6C0KWD1_9ZZZZ|tara:strand:+ start:4791 stop:5156 length:366 start_codon:yes stop_codon:yes gene_type:complete
MFAIGKALRTASHTFAERVNRGNFRNFGTSNILDMHAIDLLHNDFDEIEQLKNDQFHLPFVVTEIPPPFCPKCNNYVKNKCLFSPIRDISIEDFDLAANPNLIIQCPIFGGVSAIDDESEK